MLGQEGLRALVWTTTPWTLPANRAIAFHPSTPYVTVRLKGRRLLASSASVSALEARLGPLAVEDTVAPDELAGWSYAHPLTGEPMPFWPAALAATSA